VLDQSHQGVHIAGQGGAYRHPVELGDLSRFNCTHCHQGGRGFQHPVELGDISTFQCVDCHAKPAIKE
jgi:hypothetical protein